MFAKGKANEKVLVYFSLKVRIIWSVESWSLFLEYLSTKARSLAHLCKAWALLVEDYYPWGSFFLIKSTQVARQSLLLEESKFALPQNLVLPCSILPKIIFFSSKLINYLINLSKSKTKLRVRWFLLVGESQMALPRNQGNLCSFKIFKGQGNPCYWRRPNFALPQNQGLHCSFYQRACFAPQNKLITWWIYLKARLSYG
jgi:hypothetical protein